MIAQKNDKPQTTEHSAVSCAFMILCIVCGYCFFVGELLSAQTPRKQSPKDLPPSAFKLIAIQTTGPRRYTSDEVIAASGLQIGQTVSEDDFKQAARVLRS